METVSNGTYAPLSRPIFIYVNNSAKEREEVQTFAKFYLENAPNLVQDVGYIPLPSSESVSYTHLTLPTKRIV